MNGLVPFGETDTMGNNDASERELSWFYASRGGELGLKGQSYDFSAPHVAFAGSDDAICNLLFGRRTRRAATNDREIGASVRMLTFTHPDSAAIAREVYTPKGWAPDMDAVRITLSLGGARHTTSLLAIAHRSKRLRAARDEKKPNEGLLEFLRWQVAQQANQFVRGVRSELADMLERALGDYEAIRLARPSTGDRHAKWVQEMLSEAAE